MLKNQIILETNRLFLKGITPSTVHFLFDTYSKDEIIAYFNCDLASFEVYKKMHEKGMETHRTSMYFFLLELKETAEVIGDCGFHTWDFKHHRAEAFYTLRSDEFKRKGLMTEAFSQVLKFGYTELEIHRVEALVAKWNTASVKLLEHFNFKKEGTMREDYCVDGKNESSDCYSLLKWEWNELGL